VTDQAEAQPRSIWDEDPKFPASEWRREAWEDNTRLGYWEWVQHQRESAAEEAEPDAVGLKDFEVQVRKNCEFSLTLDIVAANEQAAHEEAMKIAEQTKDEDWGQAWSSLEAETV